MVDLEGVSPEELALKLTMATAEIDSIEYLNRHLSGVISARVLDVLRHPGADKLTLVDLDTGGEKIRVVCGAPNHKKDDIVALATVGTDFGNGMVIKRSVIRGEESAGMLCSERERGFSDDHSGIMILPQGTPPGVPLTRLFPGYSDVRLEIDNKSITHRPDLWSHRGFAREIGALLGRPVRDVVDHSLVKQFGGTGDISVRIDNPEAAPRYSCLVMKGITIAQSPDWLKAAVTSIGMRPINNIVDITNYVMAEIGEPMHAFDRAKLRGDEIIVRMASPGEPMVTLDGSSYALSAEDIVIADAGGPVALAGVMGGGNSEIEESTAEIVLEAANFNPVNIRKTAQRYAQRTEAAIRFEKSLSPELTIDALIRCYDLIMRVCPGASAVTGIVDAYPAPAHNVTISTSTDFIRQRLGHDIDDSRIEGILASLDFSLEKKADGLSITVPHYRATKDVSIPEDIVEEVGRIYGYDNIPPRAPFVPCEAPEKNLFRAFERKTREILAFVHAMTEISGYSFIGEELLRKTGLSDDSELRLSNPLSQEQDRLRRSLVPNMINNVRLNQRHQDEFRIFEVNRVYLKDDRTSPELIGEKTFASGAFFARQAGAPLFYDAKCAATDLLEQHMVRAWRALPATEGLPPYAHPARSLAIEIEGNRAGLVFELHPATAATFEISGPAAFFDIDLNQVFAAKKRERAFTELQKFPSAPFEISVIADTQTYADDLRAIIRGVDKNHISSVEVITIYRGNPIPEGKKSVSLKTVFAARDRTLRPDEIDALQKKVIAALEKKGFSLR
jgi:phenylalanyl-tRNA synthetase beta chain